MRTKWHRLAGLAIALTLLAPTVALAQSQAGNVVIDDGVISLGVSRTGALADAGLGLQRMPAGVEGLARLCSCSGWTLNSGDVALSESHQVFTFTTSGAQSSVQLDDVATGDRLGVVHDFHPAAGSGDLYEVTVTVENLGGSAVQPVYERSVTWSTGRVDLAASPIDAALGRVQPTTDGRGVQFVVGLPAIEPGGAQVFRLYFGAGPSAATVRADLLSHGASLVSLAETSSSTFIFGYAQGPSAVLGQTAGGGGAGRSGGGGAGRGGDGGGGGGGGQASDSGPHPTDSRGPQIGAGPLTTTTTSVSAGSPPTGASPRPSTSDRPGPSTDDSGPTDTASSHFAPLPAAAEFSGDAAALPTPELGSLSLLASGLAGMGGFGLLRWRSSRQPRHDEGLDAEGEDDQT